MTKPPTRTTTCRTSVLIGVNLEKVVFKVKSNLYKHTIFSRRVFPALKAKKSLWSVQLRRSQRLVDFSLLVRRHCIEPEYIVAHEEACTPHASSTPIVKNEGRFVFMCGGKGEMPCSFDRLRAVGISAGVDGSTVHSTRLAITARNIYEGSACSSQKHQHL